jgi:medium-chain acyl-[acyl-carrier-protein] hydrolase
MGIKYSEDYRVAYYAADVNGNMKLPLLISVALQVSGVQSANLGRSDEYIASLGLGWILTNYDVEIKRMPRFSELVTIETEAVAYNKYFCYRHFWYKDEEGNELVEIKATFALMNLIKRKMAQVTEAIISPFGSEKITRVLRSAPIQKIVDGKSTEYRVRYSDIDLNRHVNNSRYFDWLCDALGFEFLLKHDLKTLAIKYVKEIEPQSMIESNVEVITTDDKITSVHTITSEGVLRCEAELTWSERK